VVVAGASAPLRLNFDNRLALIGIDFPTSVATDDVLELTLFWRATVLNEEEYSASVVLLDEAGNTIAQSDNQHIGQIPTNRWPLSKYTADAHRMTFAPGTPPGTYDIATAVYKYGRPADRLDTLDEQGNPMGQLSRIGRVTVGRPDRPLNVAALDLPTTIDAPFAAGVRLAGYEASQNSVWAGDSVAFDLYWQADEDLAADLSTELYLRDAAGESVKLGRFPLVSAYPSSLWKAGDVWRGRHNIIVPPTLAEGNYTLILGEDEERGTEIASLTVNVPEHVMEPPAPIFRQVEQFGDVARLAGYDAPATADAAAALAVTLHWQSLGQGPESYRSFLQLLDEEGRFVAGSDQVPAGWQRPTTGWIDGEYIADTHTLSLPAGLPAGLYRLSAGLYDAATSQRLLTPAGHDSAIFETPIVIVTD
jgi:hypothetical protein